MFEGILYDWSFVFRASSSGGFGHLLAGTCNRPILYTLNGLWLSLIKLNSGR